MKLNYFLLLKAVNWKKMNSKPNRIDPSYRPRGVSWPECEKNAFYTLNDTFNKQKMQYITWRYGLHMLMVSSSTVAQHTNWIKSNTWDGKEKIEKKNTHNSIRNTRRWNRGKQNIEIKPINLNFSNECSAELRALSSKLVRCFHAVYLFSFGSLHRCYWLIYFMLFTLTAVSSYWNSFTWPIECNARMCILVLSNWNFHGNPDKQS